MAKNVHINITIYAHTHCPLKHKNITTQQSVHCPIRTEPNFSMCTRKCHVNEQLQSYLVLDFTG